MSNEETYDKAKRLVELIGIGRSYVDGPGKEGSPASPRGAHEDYMVDLQIKLRAKHMSDDQLDALLDFYTSEMGKSILQAQERIRKETSETLISKMDNSGTMGVWVRDPKDNSSDDT